MIFPDTIFIATYFTLEILYKNGRIKKLKYAVASLFSMLITQIYGAS